MSETLGRYETNVDEYVGYGGLSPLLNDAYSGDSRSQKHNLQAHEQWSSKNRERGRVKGEDIESNREEECDWYMESEKDKESYCHHGDHEDGNNRKDRDRDRVDVHERHRSRCRSEDHDRDRHSHYHREIERYHKHGYRSRSRDRSSNRPRSCSRSKSKRECDRESERHHRHRSRSRSRDKSRHWSRSRSRSGSKSKRISGFDMPPPVMMSNVAVPGTYYFLIYFFMLSFFLFLLQNRVTMHAFYRVSCHSMHLSSCECFSLPSFFLFDQQLYSEAKDCFFCLFCLAAFFVCFMYNIALIRQVSTANGCKLTTVNVMYKEKSAPI